MKSADYLLDSIYRFEQFFNWLYDKSGKNASNAEIEVNDVQTC